MAPLPPSRPSLLRSFPGHALLALFFALADMRVVAMLMPRAFVLSGQVADGVLQREPMWRVYQGRVLSPWLVRLLHSGGDLARADAWFAVLMLFLAGLSLLRLGVRLDDPTRRTVPVFLLFHVTILLLLPGLWLYPWDLFSLLVFAWFNMLALRGGPLPAMTILFAVALPNHEVALVIAGWLVLDAIVRWVAGTLAGASPRFDVTRFALGTGLVAGGAAIVEGLRTALLVRETQSANELPPLVHYGRDFHFTLVQNLNSLAGALSFDPAQGFQVVVPLFLLLVLVIAVRLLVSDPVRHGALALTTLVMLASFLCFGLVFETRVLMPLVPFVALHAWATTGALLTGRRPATRGQRAVPPEDAAAA